ncbi:hypothetical protein C8A03DRAFT_30639 [Achaetomium macrosporum]|uniref:Uncharacterized protein n=1 Tax=Achaetomium macrosporum TaxID=79813 RepID=A0AAN7HEZ6_9PEZI|nr:hypothetical protein C8A03DRAFT_30639 [Achaetomium macrosporum]
MAAFQRRSTSRREPTKTSSEMRNAVDCPAVDKALAYPDSLTVGKTYEAFLWPLPDELRADIQRATSGTLSTPTELLVDAKDAIDRGQFETMVNGHEVTLPAWGFRTVDEPGSCARARMCALTASGAGRAMELLLQRLGLDHTGHIIQAAGLRQLSIARQTASASPGLGPGSGPATVPSLPVQDRDKTLPSASGL